MKKMYLLLLFVFSIGNCFSQTLGSGVTDVDGNNYATVIIGQQEWMSENLNTTKYTNGDIIGTTPYNSFNYFTEDNPKYEWPLLGVPSYGRFYTWYAAVDPRGICPTGWHLPTANEWEILFEFLGGVNVAGGKLKQTGTTDWDAPNIGASNSSGFNSLPAGYHHFYGNSDAQGFNSFYWSSTSITEDDAWHNYLSTVGENVYINGLSPTKKLGFSCRCLKNASLSSSQQTINNLRVFPNPNAGNVLYVVSDLGLEKQIKVYDLLGKEIIYTTIEGETLDVSGLVSGVYFLAVTEAENTTVLKLIIQH